VLKKFFIFLFLLTFLFTQINIAFGNEIITERIYGNNRYLTAVEISKKTFDDSNWVILTSGENFPDALAGTLLAKNYNAPLLLVDESLSPETEEEIERLSVRNVILLGKVSQEVETKLTEKGFLIDKLTGSDRYETAWLIANKIRNKSGNIFDGTAIITNGEDFPDALSASTLSYFKYYPILLVKKDEIPETTEKALTNLNITRTIIVGGPEAVSETVEQALPNPERLHGDNRYSTNHVVIERLLKDDFEIGRICVAKGTDFPDALVAGIYSGKENIPMLIVPSITPPPTILKEWLQQKRGSIYNAIIIGGQGAVTEYIEDWIKTGEIRLPPIPEPDTKITKIVIQNTRKSSGHTIYAYNSSNELLFSSPCSAGINYATPLGTFVIFQKKPRLYSYNLTLYADYACYFKAHYAIHAWPVIVRTGSLYHPEKLGEPASIGCVRVPKEYAKKIYDDIIVGKTKVTITP